MGLANALVLAQRRLCLQSMRRHYVAMAIEGVVVMGLSCLAVLTSLPSSVPYAVKAPVLYPPVAYPLLHDVDAVVYGPKNNVTEELVRQAFGRTIGSFRFDPKYTPVEKAADVFTVCQDRETYENQACIEFMEDFGRVQTANLGYQLLAKAGTTTVPEKIPLARPHTFKLSSVLETKIDWDKLQDHQAKIEHAHLMKEKNKTAPQSQEYAVFLRKFPEEPPPEDVDNYRINTYVIFEVALCIPFLRRITAIATEIATGMKEQQRTNGLSSVNFWTGHFIAGFLIEMVYCTITALFMIFLKDDSGIPFFRHADITLVMAVMALFSTLHNLWAMLIAGALPKGRYALTAGAFLVFLLPKLDQAFSGDILLSNLNDLVLLDRTAKLRMALFPQVAITIIIRTICVFDDYEGIVFCIFLRTFGHHRVSVG